MTGSKPGCSHHTVEKTMSLSLTEFQMSLSKLLGITIAGEVSSVVHRLAGGIVEIRYAPLPPVRLGGLLELPRANVCLGFKDVGAGDRAAFLSSFDLAFQRGGG